MIDENSDQAIGGSIGNSNQFPDSEWLRTENKRYAVNLTDRDCGTAKIHVESLTEDNENNCEPVLETVEGLTAGTDCSVDQIRFTRRNDSLITLQVEQESNSVDGQHRAEEVLDCLISEL